MVARPCILFPFVVALSLVAIGCGETPPSSEFGPGGTATSTAVPKHKPPANGEYITEPEACDKLLYAVTAQRTKLGCASTTRECPNFIRAQYQPACMFYDSGSVQGCVSYFYGLSLCDDVIAEECELTTYPETAPAGCE